MIRGNTTISMHFERRVTNFTCTKKSPQTHKGRYTYTYCEAKKILNEKVLYTYSYLYTLTTPHLIIRLGKLILSLSHFFNFVSFIHLKFKIKSFFNLKIFIFIKVVLLIGIIILI